MSELPTNQYVEIQNGGYYVAGTRIGLDHLVYAFRRGECAEEILRNFPSINSLAKVYGALLFILEHPDAIEEYLRDQERLSRELERLGHTGSQLAEKSA